jgi:phosphatidylglycerol:prolipoprotein diacylglycerol transferase
VLIYPRINPIAFKVGALKVHWYGLMYLIGLAAAWCLALYRIHQPRCVHIWSRSTVADLIFYAAIGVILGGRIGYMLFYDFVSFAHHPLEMLKIWQGGMSFHGGLMGVMAALWIYSRQFNMPFFQVTDFIVPLVPLGLGAGRLGNFINGYLVGRVTHVSWAVISPGRSALPRHPSALYEFFLEGVLLFIILWWFSERKRPTMSASGLFLCCYGVFRIFCELFRQPDPRLGFIAFGWLTMGQLLSVPMIIAGAGLLYLAYRKRPNQ